MSTALSPKSAPVWAFPTEGLSIRAPSPVSDTALSNFASIWLSVGQVPLERILGKPAPGTATIEDAVESRRKFGLNCELVNRTLVAQAMGFYESQIALALGHLLHEYLDNHPIGILAGTDGPCETAPEQIRKPDVSFIAFDDRRKIPVHDNRLTRSPDLAVEVLSPGNTAAEMEMKLKEYFASGARLVWYIEPELRTARVFTAIDQYEDITSDGILRGGNVLPGFELPLTKLFEKAGPRIAE